MHLDMYLSTEFPKVIFSTFHRFLSYCISCRHFFLYNLFLLGFFILKCQVFLVFVGEISLFNHAKILCFVRFEFIYKPFMNNFSAHINISGGV